MPDALEPVRRTGLVHAPRQLTSPPTVSRIRRGREVGVTVTTSHHRVTSDTFAAVISAFMLHTSRDTASAGRTMRTTIRSMNSDQAHALGLLLVVNLLEYALDIETGIDARTAQHLSTYVALMIVSTLARFQDAFSVVPQTTWKRVAVAPACHVHLIELELLVAAQRTCHTAAFVAGITTAFVANPGAPHPPPSDGGPAPVDRRHRGARRWDEAAGHPLGARRNPPRSR
jgi:hypothetical protein